MLFSSSTSDQRAHLLRLLLIAAIIGAGFAVLRHEGGVATGEMYHRSKEKVLQADLLFRVGMFLHIAGGGKSGEGVFRHAVYLQERAVAEYEKLALGPSRNPVAMHRLGIIYGMRGYHPQAVGLLMQAAERDENRMGLYFSLAAVYNADEGYKDLTGTGMDELGEQEKWLSRIAMIDYHALRGQTEQAEALRIEQRAAYMRFGGMILVLLAILALIALAGAIVIAVWLFRRIFLLISTTRYRPPLLVPWEPLDSLEVVAALLVGMALAGLGGSIVASQLGIAESAGLARAVLISAQYLLFVGLALLVIWQRIRAPRHRKLSVLGLRTGMQRHTVWWGVAGYGVALWLMAALALVGGVAGADFSPMSLAGVGEQFIAATDRPEALVLLLILICLVAPVVEEIIFRGYVYAGIRRRLPPYAAMIISGLLFGMMHTLESGLAPLALMGVVLAWLYERTRSLVPSIVCHMLHNALVFALLVIIT